ncbi:hypothetical protein K437DRAFT_177819 [Tilletiaria anomala UBC 951]|uniref:Uncharacterized protein n=1 Tax=Tilletiaria anomala (strain ATCC 24038 / CBS 436.72 / UBC 951) TaxID=1037660 RepID=A0A066VRX4_TILAU|nr:uncharacterized protein K437DRAFT_177819 [Tilletiaria anomala UBC 951]KDN41315.1 hypothetical protein K437DRAFT_177819 [Tilletiaria anomala UBC 951]
MLSTPSISKYAVLVRRMLPHIRHPRACCSSACGGKLMHVCCPQAWSIRSDAEADARLGRWVCCADYLSGTGSSSGGAFGNSDGISQGSNGSDSDSGSGSSTDSDDGADTGPDTGTDVESGSGFGDGTD